MDGERCAEDYEEIADVEVLHSKRYGTISMYDNIRNMNKETYRYSLVKFFWEGFSEENDFRLDLRTYVNIRNVLVWKKSQGSMDIPELLPFLCTQLVHISRLLQALSAV